MDTERREKWQSRRVIISEILMVIAVIITVTLLVLVTSGYWVSEDFTVERQGFLQISSVPSGATVTIDGTAGSWLQRTNTSKLLSSGQHTITLEKDDYDTWSRTVSVNEGLLYRIHYPRLFLLERTPTPVYTATTATAATVTPDRKSLLIINNTTSWQLLDLTHEQLEPKPVDISTAFTSVSLADGATTGLYTGEILSLNWASDNEHLLIHGRTAEGATEWVLLNVKNPTTSVNLTREFSLDFTRIQIINDAASNLLVVQGGNLHQLEVPSRQLSSVLVADVLDFSYLDSEVVFVQPTSSAPQQLTSPTTEPSPQPASSLEPATDPEVITTAKPETEPTSTAEIKPASEPAPAAAISLLRLGSEQITPLLSTSLSTKVALSRFYDDKYLTVLDGTTLTLYGKNSLEAPLLSESLTFSPDSLTVGHSGEFLTLATGSQLATLDMEAMGVREWQLPTTAYGWLDSDMLYSVDAGTLAVYDFDGLNRRQLATSVASNFPVTITDDKWLYYFSNDRLIRETVTK